jgi:hypothetical protein
METLCEVSVAEARLWPGRGASQQYSRWRDSCRLRHMENESDNAGYVSCSKNCKGQETSSLTDVAKLKA